MRGYGAHAVTHTHYESGIGVVFVVFAAVFLGLAASARK